jgi:hypothetical protein
VGRTHAKFFYAVTTTTPMQRRASRKRSMTRRKRNLSFQKRSRRRSATRRHSPRPQSRYRGLWENLVSFVTQTPPPVPVTDIHGTTWRVEALEHSNGSRQLMAYSPNRDARPTQTLEWTDDQHALLEPLYIWMKRGVSGSIGTDFRTGNGFLDY